MGGMVWLEMFWELLSDVYCVFGFQFGFELWDGLMILVDLLFYVMCFVIWCESVIIVLVCCFNLDIVLNVYVVGLLDFKNGIIFDLVDQCL